MNIEQKLISQEQVIVSNEEINQLEVNKKSIETIIYNMYQSVLLELFQEIFRKSDIDIVSIESRIVPLDKVTVSSEENRAVGLYYPRTSNKDNGKIVIFSENIANQEELLRRTYTSIHTYIHEQIHAFSDDTAEKEIENGHKRVLGFREAEYLNNTMPVSKYTQLNEGMTEFLADSITSEYFRRTGGMSKTKIAEYEEQAQRTYAHGRQHIGVLVETLAMEYDLSEEMLFASFVRFYFSSEHDEDGKEYFSFPEWLEAHHPLLAEESKKLKG
jgi:hypothetical protein